MGVLDLFSSSPLVGFHFCSALLDFTLCIAKFYPMHVLLSIQLRSQGASCRFLWEFPHGQDLVLQIQLPQPLWTLILVSSTQWNCHALLGLLFPDLKLRSVSRKTVAVINLICFLPLKYHSPVPPVVQGLRIVVSHILSVFSLFIMRR